MNQKHPNRFSLRKTISFSPKARRYFLLEAQGVKCLCPRCAANFGVGGDVLRPSGAEPGKNPMTLGHVGL
jgi:hypothetical protein